MYRVPIKFFAVVVLALLLYPAIVSAQMPDRTPEKFSTTEWAAYSREVLIKYRPEDKDLIEQVNFIVSNADDPQAYADWKSTPPEITVYYGLIKLIESEDQYAFVLIHELRHLELKRLPPRTINGEYDFDLRFLYEREADQFAQETLVKLGRDPCAGYVIAKNSFGVLDPYDPFHQVMIKRLEMMLADCKKGNPKFEETKPNPK